MLAIQAKVLSLKISCGPHGVCLSIIYKTAVNRCVGDTVHCLVAMATQTGKQIYVTDYYHLLSGIFARRQFILFIPVSKQIVKMVPDHILFSKYSAQTHNSNTYILYIHTYTKISLLIFSHCSHQKRKVEVGEKVERKNRRDTLSMVSQQQK